DYCYHCGSGARVCRFKKVAEFRCRADRLPFRDGVRRFWNCLSLICVDSAAANPDVLAKVMAVPVQQKFFSIPETVVVSFFSQHPLPTFYLSPRPGKMDWSLLACDRMPAGLCGNRSAYFRLDSFCPCGRFGYPLHRVCFRFFRGEL